VNPLNLSESNKSSVAKVPTKNNIIFISRLIGLSWIIMFFLAIPTVLLIIEKIIVDGNIEGSQNNIKENRGLFIFGFILYFIILVLDTGIAIGLYHLFKFERRNIVISMVTLRLLYVCAIAISLIFLATQNIQNYFLGLPLSYSFFIIHLFLLGYIVYNSSYVAKPLGTILIISSFSYVITIFGEFLIDEKLLSFLLPIAMIPAALAEITFGIYLLVKGKEIDEKITEKKLI